MGAKRKGEGTTVRRTSFQCFVRGINFPLHRVPRESNATAREWDAAPLCRSVGSEAGL